jgi:hypothetical protein
MKQEITNDQAMRELKTLVERYCDDARFKNELLDHEFDFYAWSGIKYFLYEYERYLREEAHQVFDIDWLQFYRRKKEESIEHVLPQGENTLAVPYWAARFRSEQWSLNHNRLGNLVLTDWNSNYGKKGFDEKRGAEGTPLDAKVYRNSRWRMERELAGHQEWTEQEIQQRQEKLANFALNRWRL